MLLLIENSELKLYFFLKVQNPVQNPEKSSFYQVYISLLIINTYLNTYINPLRRNGQRLIHRFKFNHASYNKPVQSEKLGRAVDCTKACVCRKKISPTCSNFFLKWMVVKNCFIWPALYKTKTCHLLLSLVHFTNFCT